MASHYPQALFSNFLGHAPDWYKKTILGFLVANALILYTLGPVIAGWCLIAEFIFTLAMALKCYPLQPGGLLALEAILLGLASPGTVFHEVENNFEVILLLIFMVAGIYFMRGLLLFVFTKLLLKVHSKLLLSLLFSMTTAFLSAFLDALTVTAVLIGVCVGFYSVYHKVASGKKLQASDEHDASNDAGVVAYHRSDLETFRAFLRSLVMHGAVGTALGGVCTMVGEPQNLLIAEKAGWDFLQFFLMVAPVSLPVLAAGLLTCLALEATGVFGYGARLPDNVRQVLVDFDARESHAIDHAQRLALAVQALVAVVLILALAFHVAEVGLVGLLIIILLTAFNGIVEEHQIGRAFQEALPFTALLVVFFSVVAVIHEQHLFTPVIEWVLSLDKAVQPSMLFLANGLLSMISDNVFVATIYIDEIQSAHQAGHLTLAEFERLAVAVNTGTNLPSVATPNGQAAFLFLLTSALAPLIRLSYGKMVWMALPYTVVMTAVGLACVAWLLP